MNTYTGRIRRVWRRFAADTERQRQLDRIQEARQRRAESRHDIVCEEW